MATEMMAGVVVVGVVEVGVEEEEEMEEGEEYHLGSGLGENGELTGRRERRGGEMEMEGREAWWSNLLHNMMLWLSGDTTGRRGEYKEREKQEKFK